jgi:hypothetical protein
MTVLSACGGSGDGGSVTIRILGDPALDGIILTDGTAVAAGGGPATGDIDAVVPGVGGRVLYSFPLGAIPPGATLQSVTLELHQRLVIGTPYATHGVVVLDHLDYGPALDFGDFNLVALAPSFAVASADTTLGMKSVTVTAQVLADLAAARPNSQYRLRFSTLDTNNDGANDVAGWEDAELSGGSPVGSEPKLIVTYVP